MTNSSRRIAARALALTASSGFVTMATAAPVWAMNRDAGDDPGPGLSVLQTFLIFVAAPVAITGVITLLVMAPSWTRRGRLSAESDWSGDPLRISDPALTVASASGDPAIESGSSQPSGGESIAGGGAGARW